MRPAADTDYEALEMRIAASVASSVRAPMKMTGTVAGRMSSSQPNISNVPVSREVRNARGRETRKVKRRNRKDRERAPVRVQGTVHGEITLFAPELIIQGGRDNAGRIELVGVSHLERVLQFRRYTGGSNTHPIYAMLLRCYALRRDMEAIEVILDSTEDPSHVGAFIIDAYPDVARDALARIEAFRAKTMEHLSRTANKAAVQLSGIVNKPTTVNSIEQFKRLFMTGVQPMGGTK